jgi:DNA-directed RNA polymerase sigma subunit (sigma70/sigma32)
MRHDGFRWMRLRTTREVFAAWKAARADRAIEAACTQRPDLGESPTLGEIELRVIERRLHALRPDHTYEEIADSLGITRHTLKEKRALLNHEPNSL